MYPNHHAILYIGRESFSVEHFKGERDKTHDVVIQNYAEFRINDARSLITLAMQTPVHLERQCFVVIADSIAVEAQNALLKLLEEPPDVSSFVFVLPQNTLLTTLRSRFMIMDNEVKETGFSSEFLEFLKETIPERLSRISTLLDKKKTEEMLSLRESLVQYLQTKRHSLSVSQSARLHWLISQMPLRGSSSKMLWEDVAFTLPVEVLLAT